MQHDITHCRNRRCPKHQECYRFRAHEEIIRLRLEGEFSYYYIPMDDKEQADEVKRGECRIFLPDR